jgi:signal transduction histidine kinase
MIFCFENVDSKQEGFAQIAALAASTKNLWADRLKIDFARCKFFEANMAAPLAMVLAKIADELNIIEIVGVPLAVEHILRKNRFLVAYGFKPMRDLNRTTLPFRRIQLAEAGLFADYLERHLKGKGIPKMTKGVRKVFRQSVFEVFQNAVNHSESRLGIFICGQFYPQLQRLDLTIADAGVGIRTTVRHHLKKNISSVAAIRWALEAGHTTKIGPQPGGVGLKFLKDFISRNQGKIQIVSRFGLYEFHNQQESCAKLSHDFPGTAINLEINTADTNDYTSSKAISLDSIF